MQNLLEELHAVLASTPLHWKRLTDSLSAELLTRPPAAGQWSALDCLRHLYDTEVYVFPPRVEAFLAGRDFDAFDPDTQGTPPDRFPTPAALADAFAQRRAEGLNILGRVTPVDLTRTARHSELGRVSLSEMLHEWAGHDLMHTVQGERALMQPFIAECGPWRIYFTDHIAEPAQQA